jgi:hypothetical protein
MFEKEFYNRIIQVLPAQPGWEAVYAGPFVEGPVYYTQPVICWAVVEHKESSVMAMVPRLESGELAFVTESNNFLGYNYPGCDENWGQQAQRYWEKEHAAKAS